MAVSRRVHRRDQRPAQPHRPWTRDAPAHRAFAALVQARRQPGVVHQRAGGVEAFQLPDLAPDHRRENVTQSGKGLQPGDLGKVLLHAAQTGLALVSFGGEKIVEAQELLHALARGFGQLLLLQPGPTRGGEGVRPTQSRHLQQTAHPVLDPRPQHRHPAALPSPQPQLANRPGWKPGLRQRVRLHHRELARQALGIQAVRLLLAQTVEGGGVHPVRSIPPARLLPHAHHKVTAGRDLQGDLGFRGKLGQQVEPVGPRRHRCFITSRHGVCAVGFCVGLGKNSLVNRPAAPATRIIRCVSLSVQVRWITETSMA